MHVWIISYVRDWYLKVNKIRMYIEKDEVSVNMILVTYLPFYRLHEVLQYFVKNIEILQPKHNIVYVDNVYNERQNEIIKKLFHKILKLCRVIGVIGEIHGSRF